MLKDKFKILLGIINYDTWKTKIFPGGIDLLWNSFVIFLIIIFWNNGSSFLKGASITLFFIVLLSYTKDFKKVFTDK